MRGHAGLPRFGDGPGGVMALVRTQGRPPCRAGEWRWISPLPRAVRHGRRPGSGCPARSACCGSSSVHVTKPGNVKTDVKTSALRVLPVRQVLEMFGGEYRNRTGVHGFAIRCVTTPPTRLAGFGSGVSDPAAGRRFGPLRLVAFSGRQPSVLAVPYCRFFRACPALARRSVGKPSRGPLPAPRALRNAPRRRWSAC